MSSKGDNVLKRLFDQYRTKLGITDELLATIISDHCKRDLARKSKYQEGEEAEPALRASNMMRQINAPFTPMMLYRALEMLEVKVFNIGIEARQAKTRRAVKISIRQIYHDGEYKNQAAIDNKNESYNDVNNILKNLFTRILTALKISNNELLNGYAKQYCKRDEARNGRVRTLGNTTTQLMGHKYTPYIFLMATEVIGLSNMVLYLNVEQPDGTWIKVSSKVFSVADAMSEEEEVAESISILEE